MKNKMERMQLEVTVQILNKKRGDGKLEAFLTREAASWVKFLLSPKGVEVLTALTQNKKAELTAIAVEN